GGEVEGGPVEGGVFPAGVVDEVVVVDDLEDAAAQPGEGGGGVHAGSVVGPGGVLPASLRGPRRPSRHTGRCRRGFSRGGRGDGKPPPALSTEYPAVSTQSFLLRPPSRSILSPLNPSPSSPRSWRSYRRGGRGARPRRASPARCAPCAPSAPRRAGR